MKKILGMAGLLIAAVIFAYTFRLKTVGYLDTSVMAVTDRQMTGTLKAGISDHEDRRIVTLQKYQAGGALSTAEATAIIWGRRRHSLISPTHFMLTQELLCIL